MSWAETEAVCAFQKSSFRLGSPGFNHLLPVCCRVILDTIRNATHTLKSGCAGSLACCKRCIDQSESWGKGQLESKDDTSWSALENHKALIETSWKSIYFAPTCVVYLLSLECTSSWSVSKTVRQEMEEGDGDVGMHSLSSSHETLCEILLDAETIRVLHLQIRHWWCEDCSWKMYKNIQWNWFYFTAVEFRIFFMTVLAGGTSEYAELCALSQRRQPESNSHKFMLTAFFKVILPVQNL